MAGKSGFHDFDENIMAGKSGFHDFDENNGGK
jgi:hypothetical protein